MGHRRGGRLWPPKPSPRPCPLLVAGTEPIAHNKLKRENGSWRVGRISCFLPPLLCITVCSVCVCVCACSVVSDSLGPHGLYPASLLCPWDSPGKNPGVGCHFLLQEIFLTQGSNPGLLNLLHFGWILYLLSPFREAPVSYYLVLLSPSILCTKLP